MPRIQQLPNSLINQIAAGEVIERPASVVKEIIENAIDAGATQIDIDIEDGGGKLIRVRDNGCGIHPDDLALAFATHATSKIRNLDDLEHITTLGFRGEALPSIASVSKTTLTSRAEGESSAWRISPHLGDAISPAAHPPGTTIEIRDLFYNTPARKKFLKSERTERQHIQQLVQNLALSHDGITIRLNNHGKPLGVYGGEGLAARIASVLGDDLLEQALPIDARAADMHLYGWVGLPTSATNQPERQYFYINGRIIRDKIIAHAIRQAYQDMLYHGRHPVYVLYLDIAPEHIDVNAHPAKHEVRFRESRLTHDFLYSSLHHALRAIHNGEQTRVGTGYGPDLDPLAREIDDMLERNARIVARARGHAADLSHALKKPLALLGAETNNEHTRQHIANMNRLIERHLARAGSGAGDMRRIDLAASLAQLTALMRRLHAARNLDWQLHTDGDLHLRAEQTDLEEMLGNLLDNAGKWAASRVRTEARHLADAKRGHIQITIEDDGPGLTDEQIARAARRGERFDQSTAGNGLGIPIAADLAETYDGSLELGRSALGGLQITLRLPC